MFCPKCGTKVEEGSMFCSKCGADLSEFFEIDEDVEEEIPESSLEESADINEEEKTAGDATAIESETADEDNDTDKPKKKRSSKKKSSDSKKEDETVKPKKKGGATQTSSDSKQISRPAAIVQPKKKSSSKKPPKQNKKEAGVVQPKKKRGKKGVAAIVLIAVVALGAFAFLKFFGGKLSKDDTYVLLSDGKYKVTSNLSKEKSIELAATHSDSVTGSYVRFSPDRKYVYFYTKVEDYDDGTLSRAEISKLKSNSNKNDKYIETIASNVRLGLDFFKNGTVVYRNAGNNLYYFDGKEPVQIAKNVTTYYLDDNSKIIYLVENETDDGDYEETLYGVDINSIDDKKKMATNVGSLQSTEDFNNILFTKYDDDWNEALYTVGFDKESEKINTDVSMLTYSGDGIFYTAETGEKLSLYDYVEDTTKDDFYYDDFRDELKDPENAVKLSNLYEYADGKEKLIAENVINAEKSNDLIVYNTADMIDGKVSIEDVWETNDVRKLFNIDYAKAIYVMASNTDQKLKMNAKVADDIIESAGEDDYISFSNAGSDIYIRSEEELWSASIENGEITNANLIADDATYIGEDDTNYYYMSGLYENNDTMYGDLYAASNGKSTKLAQDVLSYNIAFYKDGSLIAYTDYRYYSDSDDASGDIAIFDTEGKKKDVGTDVTQFVRKDKSEILFISDDNLYSFKGKEKKLLQNDVERIWCSKYIKRHDVQEYDGRAY